MRVEQIGDATLYLGDCRDILPMLPKVDAVITDPPYGCKATTGRGGAYHEFVILGDSDTSSRDWLIGAIDCPWIMFGSPRIPKPPGVVTLIWSNGAHTGMGDLAFPWKPDYEEIYVSGSGFSGRRTSSVLCINARTDSGRAHPTEKPVDLMGELVRKSPGGIILDPFMGSGTTGVAAIQEGRKFIGIELESSYFNTAVKRITHAVEMEQQRILRE